MHMVISTDNKKIKIFLPRNVSGLFKYSINIPGVLNIYICWSFVVCLFFKNLVQKRKHQKAKKGLGLLRLPDSVTEAEEASVSE